MQKISTLLVAFVLMFGYQNLSAEGIDFEHGTWGEALKKAQQEDKLIFLDAYTTWCGPCKWMTANVMNQPEVGEFFNKHFVNVKMDMEKGEGLGLAKKFGVGAYPTLAFVDAQSAMVWRVAGALDTEQFLALGQKIVDGVEPVQKMYDKFASGKYDKDFLYKYLIHTQEVAMRSNGALEEYLKLMKPEDLRNEQDFDVFVRFFSKTDSEYFKEFEKNMEMYKELHGAEKVEEKYYGSFLRTMQRSAYENDQEGFQAARKRIGDAGGEQIQGSVTSLLVFNASKNESPEKGYEMLTQFVDEGKTISPSALNQYAWEVYEKVDEPDIIEQAIRWAQVGTELEPNPMIMDTWGMLLYKHGELEAALEKLEAALELAKESGTPMTETEEAIMKIKGEL